MLPHDKNNVLSQHFRAQEFHCKCGQDTCVVSFINRKLLTVLEYIRSEFNRPVRITSGYRCPTHNENVGGSRMSQHVHGNAADIQVDKVDPKDVQDFLEDKYPNQFGIGRYNDFTHIDVRSNPARWGE